MRPFKPVTCLARHAHKTERLPQMIHDAFCAAMAAKRGPAFINIPRDLLEKQTIDAALVRPSSYRPVDLRLPGGAGGL